MHINGDEILNRHPELKAELASQHKLKEDPRITRIGKFLRKYSLDELPQLFNVLRAEMSLVGPRMIAPAELAQYNQWGINLLTVRPGLTGLWQVSGRSDVGYDERVRLDMFYVRNWTIWQDPGRSGRTFRSCSKPRRRCSRAAERIRRQASGLRLQGRCQRIGLRSSVTEA